MNKLREFFRSLLPDERAEFAVNIGSTVSYLNKMLSLSKKDKLALLGPKLCTQIEVHSDGKVTRKDLRPDDWQEIWPELKKTLKQAA